MDTPKQRDVDGFAVVVAQYLVQKLRIALEHMTYLDGNRKIQRLTNGSVAIPIINGATQTLSDNISVGADIEYICRMALPQSKKVTQITPRAKLLRSLKTLLKERQIMWTTEIEKDVAVAWERRGDLVLLPHNSFQLSVWKRVGEEVWHAVAEALSVTRVGRQGTVCDNGYRSAQVSLLLGVNGCVRHIENGIVYCYDITKCMCSSGNITEKLRLASFSCQDEVVVDMYAGIGYFTLPYLVHARAKLVHACEWNSAAVEALHRNLAINDVALRCIVHHGDNRQVCPRGVADRVNLGLIPSSQDGWPVACAALKPRTGGILHIHMNVASYRGNTASCDCNHSRVLKDRSVVVPPGVETLNCTVTNGGSCSEESSGPCNIQTLGRLGGVSKRTTVKSEWVIWARQTASQIKTILDKQCESDWMTTILHVERVKSYAPHIDHLVLDLECRPANISC